MNTTNQIDANKQLSLGTSGIPGPGATLSTLANYPKAKITEFTRKVNQSGLPPPRKAKEWYHSSLKDIMTREGIK